MIKGTNQKKILTDNKTTILKAEGEIFKTGSARLPGTDPDVVG